MIVPCTVLWHLGVTMDCTLNPLSLCLPVSRTIHPGRTGLRHRLFAMLIIALFVAATPVRAQPLSSSQPSGSQRALARQILALINAEGARQAHWGIELISLKDGDELVGWNQDKLFVPASTAKLFVAAAAVTRLGPDFRYVTTVESAKPIGEGSVIPGDLVLVGRGDPNLSGRTLPYQRRTTREDSPTVDFEELAAQLVAKGVKRVEGNLIADDSYFAREPLAPGWAVDDLMWNYGAPVSALAINDNVQFLTIIPGVVGGPAAISLDPMVNFYELDNRIRTLPRRRAIPGGGSTAAASSLSMQREPGSNVLHLWGQLAEGDAGWGRGIAIEDPPRFAGEFFKQELARQSVEVKGTVEVRRLDPADVPDLKGAPGARRSSAPADPIAAHESLPLAESVKVILKASQNLHAEMLLRTLGREQRGVGSREAGLEEIKGFLDAAHVPQSDVLLDDASGLSRQTLVSPRAMMELLRYMDQSEYGSLWNGLLPVAGRDGSLGERLKGRATAGRVWAKTGSLSGVAALAGYALNEKNERLGFVIFANQFNPLKVDAAEVIDRIVETIARSR
jgi:serine-type D-Ala-D-Ala carboxypeptidase/endopeptidase (penicillin-binding protein 4)